MFGLARVLSLGLVALPYVSAAVHDVQVGAGGQLVFSPEAIAAQPGDQVVFHFNPKKPHGYAIILCKPLRSEGRRFRFWL